MTEQEFIEEMRKGTEGKLKVLTVARARELNGKKIMWSFVPEPYNYIGIDVGIVGDVYEKEDSEGKCYCVDIAREEGMITLSASEAGMYGWEEPTFIAPDDTCFFFTVIE